MFDISNLMITRLMGLSPLIFSLTLHAAALLLASAPKPGPIVVEAHQPSSTARVHVQIRARPIVKKQPISKPVQKEIPLSHETVVSFDETIEAEEYIEHREDALPSFSPTPEYPRMARMRGMEGFVRLKIGVNASGVPIIVELLESSGFDILDQAAIRGLQRWRFPSTTSGEQLSFWTEKVIEFQLR
jgi:TonB family protein